MICVGMITVLAVGDIQLAIQSCQDERDCVVAERDAFQTFQTRIKRVEPVKLEPDKITEPLGTQSCGIEPTTSPGDATLRYVLTAYENSVRSLSHYKSGYDETLAESLAAGLGEDIVTSLVTNTVLTPPTQQTLIERAQNAIDVRTALVDAISTEISALVDRQETLCTLETKRENLRAHLDSVHACRKDAAFDVWCGLYELETELDKIAQQRQATLANSPMKEATSASSAVEEVNLYEYLYEESDAPRYPVLSAVGMLGARISADRNEVSSHFG